jgi:uncharacterized repeat protein (TIGR03843 family)
MSVRERMATSFTDAFALLTRGRITLRGRMPASSNATFLAELELDGAAGLAVYKPGRGERPLWDFPPGLFARELAAYLLSEALRWGLVPPTVRREGPYGEGSLQLFVPADFAQHYFTLRENPAHHECLRRICVFDLVANNADRKAGHCLLAPDGAIFAVDNGLCFHVESKLRTVIWDFGGEPIPEGLLDDLRRFLAAPFPDALAALLAPAECLALLERARVLAQDGRFPADASGVRYPWPLV